MKRLLLLFALKYHAIIHAIMLPSINNPAIWDSRETWLLHERHEIAIRYSEPFKDFHNGKIDIAWSDGHFLAAAGFGSAALDSAYRELEFSGFLAFKPFDFLSLSIGETANLPWIPEGGSWQEHEVSASADFFYDGWARLSFSQAMRKAEEAPLGFSWLISCEANFSSLYSFGGQLPINKENSPDFLIYQQIALGHFTVYNSFAYPGPALGFGFAVGAQGFSAAASHMRGSYPSGHTGYAGRLQVPPKGNPLTPPSQSEM